MAPKVAPSPPSGEPFYSVTQLGSDLNISARTIRFYEDKGLITPRRAGNNRVYTVRDRARMILILRGKKLGFSLREIREYLDLYDADPRHAKQLRLLMTAVRARLALLEDQAVALAQAVAELRDIETQARGALEALEAAPGTPRACDETLNTSDEIGAAA